MDKGHFNAADAVKEHYARLAKKDQRPNILILMTDQQRYDTIKAHGFDHMVTPNLDRLAEEGTSYSRAYTPNPICCPARHNFITGLGAKYHGIADNDFQARLRYDIPAFPELITNSGYQSAAIGKMHFQPMRAHHGFERLKLMEEVPEHREDDDYLMHLKENGYGNVQNIHGVRNLLYMLPQRSLLPPELHGTQWVADQGIDFIKENNGKRPFLLYLSWIAPHPPFNSVEEFAKLYEGKDIPMPCESQTPRCELSEENAMLGDIPNDDVMRRMREIYYRLISHVDHHVGRVLQSLEDTGELDNTLIIFTTDHGELLGDNGLYQKWLPYDACSRIPFIIRYPKGFEKGGQCEEFVDLNDIFPTLLDVAGVEYPAQFPLMGESLLRPIEEKVKNRDYQYVAYAEDKRRWCSIVSKTHKYNYFYGGGREELFDLTNDPQETCNLLYGEGASEHESLRLDLRQRLVKYEQEHWYEGYIKNNDFIRLDPYEPNPSRNVARPQFPKKLTKAEERDNINDFYDEVADAMKDESVVKVAELDYKTWQKNFDVPKPVMDSLLEN